MRKLVFSKTAAAKLDELLNYLETAWTPKVKLQFITKLDKVLQQIAKYPMSAEKSHLVPGLHKIVVTKQTTIYYKHNESQIFVVAVFDTRQSKVKLETSLKKK